MYDDDSGVFAFHNPYAKIPLSDDYLPDQTVRHGRLSVSGPAKAVIVKGPDGLKEI